MKRAPGSRLKASSRHLWILSTLVCLGFYSGVEKGRTSGVLHQERSLQPGEVLHFGVKLAQSANEVKAEAFEKTFSFYPSSVENGDTWEGLLGIDLNIKPGKHEVRILATRNGARVFESTETLTVVSKEFPTRRINVEERFVSPPQEELERIRLEAEKVSEIFSKTTSGRLWRGAFLRPVPGEAISSFGKKNIVNGQPRSPHSGTDFRAAEGTPVKAPNAGKVVLVEDLYFAGKTVILDHGLGLYSYFAHLSESSVSEGDLVEKGEVLGKVGATGRVTGPHLHWSLRLGNARVDPLSLMAVLDAVYEITE